MAARLRYSYTASTAGTFLVNMDALNETSDPIVYVRRLCDYNIGEFGRDLSCGADRSESDRNATASMTLEAGETVFIFADAYSGPIDSDGDGQDDVIASVVQASHPVCGSVPLHPKSFRRRQLTTASATISV